jgi:hypothetical protein
MLGEQSPASRPPIQEEYVRKKWLLSALAGAIALAVAAVAIANPAADTTLDVTAVVKPKKSGTKKDPKPVSLTLTIAGGTASGTGQPSTTTAINTTLPSTWLLNSKKWPKAKRCDIDAVNNAKSDSVCPKGSKIGTGSSQAKAGNGTITQDLDVTAYVIKNGNVGFFLVGTTPVSIQVMIEGVVSGKQLKVAIPQNIQEPVPGFATGITLLKVAFGVGKLGKVIVKGEQLGIIESKGCKNKQWEIKVQNVYRDGENTDTDTVPCSAPKKKKK